MADSSKMPLNLIMDAHEPDLKEEAVAGTFFAPLTTDAKSESNYQDDVPSGIVSRKTATADLGAKSIKFGMSEQLEGRGRYEDEQLVGHEEKLTALDNAVHFSEVRHGVKFPHKGLQKHYAQAYDLFEKKRKTLSTWNGRVAEEWAWQALLKGCNDRANAVHGAESPQSWHPHVYSMESGGLSRATWSASNATYMTNLSTLINNTAAGDILTVDRVYEAEQAADELLLERVPISIDGVEEELLVWAYPLVARKRMKKAFESFWLQGDVRGPNNRAFKGDKFKFGNFLFVEARYIPRLARVDSNTVKLEGAWEYSETAGKRQDARAAANGITHAILGKEALYFAEPDELTWDTEDKDYKYQAGLGTYRMMGYRRGNEFFDDRKNYSRVVNQGSLLLIENTAAA